MSDRGSRNTWLLATTFLSLGYCLPGAAQAQAPASSSVGTAATEETSSTEGMGPSGDAEQGGDIVVTARKQSEVLSKVGLSITAATGIQLAERGIDTVAELVKLEPSFQFATSYNGTPVLTIRGIGYGDNSIQAPLAVSIYQDEIPHPFSVMTKGVILDVQRVEILKGPQGILYGQNSTGGAINFLANKPTDHFTAGVAATYGNYNAAHLDGYVSGPLTDTLKARLAVATDQGGAWQRSYTRDDKLGDKKAYFGRLLLDWKPTDTFSAVLNVNAWRDKSDFRAAQLIGLFIRSPQSVGLGRGNSMPTPAQIAAMPAFAAEFQRYISQPLAPSDANAADWIAGTHPHVDQKFYQASLRMDWTASSAFSLTSLTSFQHYSQDDDRDLSGARVLGVVQRSVGSVDSFFQELRAHGEFGESGANWQIGVNFIHDKSDEIGDQLASQSGGYLTGSPPSIGVNPPSRSIKFYGNATTETKSVFGNVSVPLLASLKLNAGVRYTDVNSDFGGCVGTDDPQLEALIAFSFGDNIVRRGQCVTVLSRGGPSGFVTNNLHEHNIPWRVGLEWQATNETLIYALVSKGFKAGLAPLLAGTVASQFDPITQESLLNYEAGVKTRLFDNRLSVNADVFYYDHRDKQLVARVIDPVFGSLSKLANIPKSHVFGAEASIVLKPVTGITLDGAVTYLNSRVDSDFPNNTPYGDVTNFKGQHFPYTPKWSASGGARYDWALNDRFDAHISMRGSYQTATAGAFGQSTVAALGRPSLAVKAYGVIDLSAGIEPASGDWRFEIWGRNLTDTYYWTSVNYNGDGTVRAAGMPATYGFSVSYKFGSRRGS